MASDHQIARASMIYKGQWSVAALYNQLDIVSYEGSSYLCLRTNTGVAVNNLAYWAVIALQGEQGPKGDSGLNRVHVSTGPPTAGTGEGSPQTGDLWIMVS